MADVRDQVIEFVGKNGPSLPVQISKIIGSNILMAGAVLSELVERKKLLVSNTKKGGSPYYYAPGQENRLQEIANNLKDKEKEAYEFIKEKKVIRDIEALPWQRIALRMIKDFAVPLNVSFDNKNEVFWKWYLAPDEEVGNIATSMINKEIKETVKEEIKEVKPEIKEEIKEIKQEIKKDEIVEQQTLMDKPKVGRPKKQVKKDVVKLDFFTALDSYLKDKNIDVIEQKIIKNGKEIDIIGNVPAAIGSLKFFIKVKNKKTISEADLSLAYNEAQNINLPILFLTNGSLSKKAEEYLEKNLRGQLTFNNI